MEQENKDFLAEQYKTFFEAHIEVKNNDYYTLPNALFSRLKAVFPKNRMIQINFKAWLEREKGFKRKQIRNGPYKLWVYRGIRLKKMN